MTTCTEAEPLPGLACAAAIGLRTAASPPWQLPLRYAFPLLATVLFAFFFAAAAPSPLFVVFQHAWGFSASMLTVAFAIYALALMASLLVAGSLSDHVGRRPVVLAALVLQAVAMGLFVTARGVGGLLVARVVQGVAMGVASGALSAAVVEAAPEAKKRLGALISSVSPLAGLAVGALATGIAVKLSVDPVFWVFSVLVVVFAVGAVAVLCMPETATRRPGAWRSLMPRMSIPPRARGEFMRGLPVFVTIWALGGLYLALAPSIVQRVFGVDSGVVNGLTIAVMAGVGAAAPSLLGRFVPLKTVLIGMTSIVIGLVLLLASLGSKSLPIFFVGTAIAGVGFGAAFSAMIQRLAPLAAVHERAELFAGIFVVCYLAMSVPAMAAGLLVAPFGLLAVVEGYAAALLLLGAIGALLQWSAFRRDAVPALR